MAVSRHGRTHESSAVGWIFGSSATRTRDHTELSIEHSLSSERRLSTGLTNGLSTRVDNPHCQILGLPPSSGAIRSETKPADEPTMPPCDPPERRLNCPDVPRLPTQVFAASVDSERPTLGSESRGVKRS